MSRLDAALRRAQTGVVVSTPPPEPAAVPPEVAPQHVTPRVAEAPGPVTVPPAEVSHPEGAPGAVPPAAVTAPATTPSSETKTEEMPGRASQKSRPPAGTFKGFAAEHLEKLVISATVPQPLRETYRRLAATLHAEQSEHGTKVLMISSAVPDEGKTLTAANIALTLSESYEFRVLLIDADLRRPSLDTLFSTGRVQGLNEALTSVPPRQVPVIRVSKWLSLLPAGKPDPDPMSSLTSERMRRLLAEAASQYDWVIIDTPPVGILTDAKLLGSMVDGALLVVRAGKTPSTLVQQAIDALGRERILGVVLNRTETRHTFGAYSAYGSDYYYGTKR